MGLTKTETFSRAELRIAALAKALAHPARIAILQQLAQRNECICGEIVEELPLSQSTVSQHLKELKSAGLIKGAITGVKSCYCIDREGWKEAEAIFAGLFRSLAEGKSCC